MNRVPFLAALLVAACALPASAGVTAPASQVDTPVVSPIEPQGTGANFAILDVGAPAPDFAFESRGQGLRLHDLRDQGHVLIVFQPDDRRLVALERVRPRLLALGVVPVAVMNLRTRACNELASRLGLHFAVIADGRGVIGAQFNALDPNSLADIAAWFVVDRAGRVRDLAHLRWPERDWTEVAAAALGLPGAADLAPAAAHGAVR